VSAEPQPGKFFTVVAGTPFRGLGPGTPEGYDGCHACGASLPDDDLQCATCRFSHFTIRLAPRFRIDGDQPRVVFDTSMSIHPSGRFVEKGPPRGKAAWALAGYLAGMASPAGIGPDELGRLYRLLERLG